jgi:PD-(D/E)XK nuclease superfamily
VIIPRPPIPSPIKSISPTLYETLLACPARAAWVASGHRDKLVPHPSAILGTCFHRVMEAVQRTEITGSPDECRLRARSLFDDSAGRIHSDAHPLIRVKFPVPEKLPFYNLFRERAAELAARYAAQRQESAVQHSRGHAAIAERRFESSDGLIIGQPDLVDVTHREVIDYKTGRADEPWRVSEREARQLSLYAHLADEAGIDISRGVIVRGNGESAAIDIPPEMAAAEARRARDELARYNARIDGESFYDLARPSPDSCRMCPCQPMCEAFWETTNSTWQDTCGVHIEGVIVDVETATVQGIPLLTLGVEASRGTVETAAVTIEQMPLSWTTADGDRPPEPGDVGRLVDARQVDAWQVDGELREVVRADRVTTSLWRVADMDS